MTDIPPGSGHSGYSPPDRYPVEARWGDYVAECLIHRYQTSAERDSIASAAPGAASRPQDQILCYTADSKQYWIWSDATSSWNPMGLGSPTGTVIDYMGGTPPTGYIWCDGVTYTVNATNLQLAKLLTGLANPSSFTSPDMRGYVTCMAGGGFGGWGVGSKHGAMNMTLQEGHLASHKHNARSGEDAPDHSHSISLWTDEGYGAHTHTGTGFNSGQGVGFRGEPWNGAGGWDMMQGSTAATANMTGWYTSPPVAADGSNHRHPMNGNTTGVRDNRHYHSVTVDPAGSGQAFGLLQPTFLVNKAIKL